MKLANVLLLLLPTASGQVSNPVQGIGDIDSITGIVQTSADRELRLESGRIVRADPRTRVWKDRVLRHTFSSLKPGDKIRVRYSGATIAEAISTDMVTFSGVVRKATAASLEVATGSVPFRAQATRLVRLAPHTRVGIAGEVPAVGQEIHVVGWDFGEGGIDAERIAVYNTDLPARPDATPRRR